MKDYMPFPILFLAIFSFLAGLILSPSPKTIYVPKNGNTAFDDHGWHYYIDGLDFVFDRPIVFTQRKGWPPVKDIDPQNFETVKKK